MKTETLPSGIKPSLENLTILCFGDSDWWYHNRGHMDMQLMKQFAKFAKVLYVNSIVVRKFNIHEGSMFLRRAKRKLRSIMRGIKPSGIDNMTIYSPFTMPVHHINIARQLNALALLLQIRRCMRKLNIQRPIIWVACPGAAETAIKLQESISMKKNNLYVGRTEEILVSKLNKYGKPLGMTRTMKPVIVESEEKLEIGCFRDIHIKKATMASLVGVPC